MQSSSASLWVLVIILCMPALWGDDNTLQLNEKVLAMDLVILLIEQEMSF